MYGLTGKPQVDLPFFISIPNFNPILEGTGGWGGGICACLLSPSHQASLTLSRPRHGGGGGEKVNAPLNRHVGRVNVPAKIIVLIPAYRFTICPCFLSQSLAGSRCHVITFKNLNYVKSKSSLSDTPPFDIIQVFFSEFRRASTIRFCIPWVVYLVPASLTHLVSTLTARTRPSRLGSCSATFPYRRP